VHINITCGTDCWYERAISPGARSSSPACYSFGNRRGEERDRYNAVADGDGWKTAVRKICIRD